LSSKTFGWPAELRGGLSISSLALDGCRYHRSAWFDYSLQKGHRDIGGPFQDLRQQCLGVSDMFWDGISGYVFYLVVGERNRSWKWLAGSWAGVMEEGSMVPLIND